MLNETVGNSRGMVVKREGKEVAFLSPTRRREMPLAVWRDGERGKRVSLTNRGRGTCSLFKKKMFSCHLRQIISNYILFVSVYSNFTYSEMFF